MHLSDLPYDLLLDILCHLLPVDLVVLGHVRLKSTEGFSYTQLDSLLRSATAQTCKTINKTITQDRALWASKLNDVAEHFSLPSHTFDLSHMTAAELRVAATRPYRFEHAFRRPPIPPFPTTPHLNLHLLERVMAVSLIPGGRYLVVLSYYASGLDNPLQFTTRIWDLSKRLRRIPIASYACPTGSGYWSDIELQTTGGERVDIAIYAASRLAM